MASRSRANTAISLAGVALARDRMSAGALAHIDWRHVAATLAYSFSLRRLPLATAGDCNIRAWRSPHLPPSRYHNSKRDNGKRKVGDMYR